MAETPEKKVIRKEKTSDFDLKKYIVIAAITFVTFCCCILFFFFIYRYNGFTEYWQKLMNILQPIIIGFIVAYLINPIMVFIERHVFPLLNARMKSERKAKRAARTIGTAGALLFFVLIILLLIGMMVPELLKSIRNMMQDLPAEVNAFTRWLNKVFDKDSELAEVLGTSLVSVTDFVQGFLQNQVLPQVNTYIATITSGVISMFKILFNFIIGLIIAVYVLMSKETFIGQSKKIVFAILPTKWGNKTVQMVRICNQMYGGFISGKILDSAIIGVICYIGLIILRMPYSLLVAVIVGVTNVVPFFGPYVGAVPSTILIALADPIKGLYFLIFILLLQQVDGNIIGPKILGESTGLSAFWVVFAILVGGGLFGFMGMLLGVPTFAVIYYIIREIVEYVLRKRKLPETTIEYIRMQDIDPKTGTARYEEE